MELSSALNILPTVLGAGGGLAGFLALYLHLKKSRKKLKIVSHNSKYHFDEKENLLVDITLNLINEKDTTQSITDMIASIRFDKMKKSKSMPKGFSVSPILPQKLPIHIKAHNSECINMRFVFPGVEISSIDRMLETKLLGFYKNIPILYAKESDLDDKWNDLPLLIRLDLHIDGNKIINTSIGACKSDSKKIIGGTFNSIEVSKIQQEFITEARHPR